VLIARACRHFCNRARVLDPRPYQTEPPADKASSWYMSVEIGTTRRRGVCGLEAAVQTSPQILRLARCAFQWLHCSVVVWTGGGSPAMPPAAAPASVLQLSLPGCSPQGLQTHAQIHPVRPHRHRSWTEGPCAYGAWVGCGVSGGRRNLGQRLLLTDPRKNTHQHLLVGCGLAALSCAPTSQRVTF